MSRETKKTIKAVAKTILDGFEKHFTLFSEITAGAQARFERADWPAVQQASRDRIYYYTKRVDETVQILQTKFRIQHFSDGNFQELKLRYVRLLLNHKQPQLAESYYNTVFCKLFHRSYYNNDNIFVRSSMSSEYLDFDDMVYHNYYPAKHGFRATIETILKSFNLKNSFFDLRRDVRRIIHYLRQNLPARPHHANLNFYITILNSLFFRNKAAYIIGKAVNGHEVTPFIVPLLQNSRGEIYVDTILLDEREHSKIFSFSRAYFMAQTDVPSATVSFLQNMLPTKTSAEVYAAIGFHKQSKTAFYRDFLYHLNHSEDDLIIAPGIKGMVMMVFTLPSYPYVFKVIKDKFAPQKKGITRQTVIEKYQLVKQHDRVGRMADSMEYSDVALPRNRMTQELLDELFATCANSIEQEGDLILIKHLYIERRMQPLNLFISHANDQELEQVILDYGNAIRQMVAANIFPGDMLYKNFGVTRNKRVVFYDYDEVCYLTECRFRTIPASPFGEAVLSGGQWYSAQPNDVFPEEFEAFFCSHPRVREPFMKYHKELLDPQFWKEKQAAINSGVQENVFPYSIEKRFVNQKF